MHYNDPMRPTPTQGFLIVDGPSLVPSCINLPSAFLTPEARATNSPVNLSSAFSFLAQHGYEVLITEVAALRYANTMRNGVSLERECFILNSSDHSPTRMIENIVGPFVSTIPQDSGNIYIAPPLTGDMSASAAYAREIWEIHRSTRNATQKRTNLIHLNRHTDKKNYCQEAAQQLILRMEETDLPIFYVSENQTSLDQSHRLREDVRVCPLSFADFYRILLKAGLLPSLGLNETDPHSFFMFINAFSDSKGLQRHRLRLRDSDNEVSIKAMEKSLIQLREEIQAAESQTPSGVPDRPVISTTGARKTFAERYGAFALRQA